MEAHKIQELLAWKNLKVLTVAIGLLTNNLVILITLFLGSCSQSKEYYKIEKIDLEYYKKDKVAGNNNYIKLSNVQNDLVDGIHISFTLVFLDSLETTDRNLPADGFFGSIDKIDTIYFSEISKKHDVSNIDTNVLNIVYLSENHTGSKLPCNNVFHSLTELKNCINNKDEKILRLRLITDGAFIPFKKSISLDKFKDKCIIKFEDGRVIKSGNVSKGS
jgi:hypothetical protein